MTQVALQQPQIAPRASSPYDSQIIARPSQPAGLGVPTLTGPAVTPAQHIAPGTGLHGTLAYGVFGLALLVATVGTLGVALIGLLFAPLVEWIQRRRIHARIVGESIRVSPEQLPEIYHAAVALAQRLGMTALPEIFVVESNVSNAVAVKIAGRNLIFLTDDVIDACLRNGDAASLNFVLAHELAHHALGHTSLVRRLISTAYKPLARLDELSADSVAAALVGHPDIAGKALVLMLTGPALLPYVSRDALLRQAQEVVANKQTKKAEKTLSHPVLMRRIARVYGLV